MPSIAAARRALSALPALVALRGAERQGCRLALVVAVHGERAALFRPAGAEPESVALSDLAREMAGPVLRFAAARPGMDDPEATGAGSTAAAPIRPFGFRWFVPELLKYKPIWAEVLGASLAIQILALTTPLITQAVIDKVLPHQTMSTLVVLTLALACAMVFSAGLGWLRQLLVIHTGNRVDAVLGTRVFCHLLGLPARYFEARPTGTLVARLHGVETIRAFVSGASVSLLLDLPFLGVFLAVMFYYSLSLTLVALGVLAVLVALSLALVPAIRARLNDQFLRGARNQAFVTEYLAGIATVKSLQMEPQLSARYGELAADYLGTTYRTQRLANTYQSLAQSLEQAMSITILALGAWLVMQSGTEGAAVFTVGMLVAFQMFASRLAQPMLRLAGLWQEFQQALIAVKRLGDIMDVRPEPVSALPTGNAATGAAEIRFEQVGFRYAPEAPDLYRSLSFSLPPGRTVALMGPSGSGKSTIAKLLQAFELPTTGRILVNGRDARHYGANELRALMGVVPQETVLFAGTIYDNLVLAHPHASQAEVIQAAKAAGIHETIEALAQGYQTRLGERGTGLSGGQRQRIAIARALLKRPRLLIFDEATANLDAATAEAFARTVNQLKGAVTMLFITHALPRGLEVDEILRLCGEGRIETLRPVAHADVGGASNSGASNSGASNSGASKSEGPAR